MEQLQILKAIYENGFINAEEYNQRKQQLIDRLTDTIIQGTVVPSRLEGASGEHLAAGIFLQFLFTNKQILGNWFLLRLRRKKEEHVERN